MTIGRFNVGSRNILAYFIVLFILPGLILAYLAFRGIQNDQALINQQNDQFLENSVTQILDLLKLRIDSADQYTAQTIEAGYIPYSFPDNSFVLNIAEQVDDDFYHWLGPTYDNDIESQSMAVPFYPEAWKYEFQDKDLNGALNLYLERLRTTKDSLKKADLLIKTGRLYVKLGDKQRALDQFDVLCNSYGRMKVLGTINAAYVGALEKIRIYESQANMEKIETEVDFLTSLLAKTSQPLDWKDYLFLRSKIFTLCDTLSRSNISARPAGFHSLDPTWQYVLEQDSISHYLHRFRTAIPNILVEKSSAKRAYVRIGNAEYLYQISDTHEDSILILYDLSRVKAFISSKMNDIRNTSWALRNTTEILESSDLEVPTDAKPINVQLRSGLPLWTVTAYSNPAGIWSMISASGQGVFLYIFLFVFLVLLFGLYLTYHFIQSEMKLSRLKSDFISTVSHEFKSPITAIRQMAERLDFDRVDSEERKKQYYRAMHAQSERLSHLVENILDFSRMESGEKALDLRLNNLNEVIKSSVDRFHKRIMTDDFPVTATLNENIPDFVFDQTGLSQVMDNLLDNAFKYAPDPRGLNITTKLKNHHVHLSVQDFGPGIAKEDQSRIFQQFYRAGDALTRSVKGSGIGLTLVKKIIDAHGGSIEVESEPGKGSTFKINLPYNNQTHEN